jgi:cytosine deaminase
MIDLRITNVQRPAHSGLWDVAIAQGVIQSVTPAASTTLPASHHLDGQGQLLIPGLVDGHIHLDKALLLDRRPAQEGTFAEAMRETFRLKQGFTIEDVQHRAQQVIERAIAFGITAMRSHVEVDDNAGLRGLEALVPLKSAYAWGLTLQIAVFAQEGITNYPGAETLLRQAMRQGGDVIGSAPYVDPDPKRNVQIIFDIAQEMNCNVDFHLDFLDDDEPLLLPFVIEETQRRGWQGRVCLGHMTKLAGLSPQELEAIAPSLKDAGISILALPASDLYMMARRDTHNQRRGVAPVHRLANWGINTGLATNNVQNLFTPFGDGDVLKIATLLAQVLQLGTTDDHIRCLNMATVNAARAIGLTNYGVEVGCVADLVLLDTPSVSGAIATAPPGRTVIKQGNVVAKTVVTSQWMQPEQP